MNRALAALGIAAAACSGGGGKARPLPNQVVDDRREDPPDARPAGAPAPLVAPGLRLAGRGFDVVAYTVTLELDPAQPEMAGTVDIAGMLTSPQDVVWIHARDVQVLEADAHTAGGTVDVEAIAGAGAPGQLALRAAKPLPPGPVTFTISYRAKLDEVDTAGTFRQQYAGDWYAFTQHEALDARRSFPCLDEPGVKVPWTLTLVVPKELTAVANAPVEREVVEGDRKRVTFATTPPLPSYLIAYAVGPFEMVPAGQAANGAPLRIVALKGRGADARWAAAATPKLLAALTTWFGMPYPYAKLDQIAIPTTVGFGAMENPGLITYRESLLLLPDDASETRRRRLAGTMTHELAHLWFGDLVTPAWWDDLWLNESFASWLPGKIVPQVFPAWNRPEELVEATAAALRADSLATARRIRQPIASEHDIVTAFDGITYGKGAAVLRMFEQHVGADAFQRGVRAYLEKHQHGNATAADFLAAIAAQAPAADVEASFGTFLEQAGAPRIGVALGCRGKPTVVDLTQRRFLPLGAAPDPTTPVWRVPVCLRLGGGPRAHDHCQVLTEPRRVIEVATRTCATWVWPKVTGLGYYRAGLTDAQWRAIVDVGWRWLTPEERLAAASDLVAAIEAGEAGVEIGLALVPKLIAQKTRPFLSLAVELAGSVRPFVPQEQIVVYGRWVQRTFGGVARKVGLVPKRGEGVDDERLRADVVALVAEAAADPALRRKAVALARDWRKLPESTRGLVLAIAVRAEPAIHDTLLAEFRTETDRTLRGDLARALAATLEADRLRAALALLLDPAIDIHDSATILQVAVGRDEVQPVATAFAIENLDALIARVPAQTAAGLVGPLAAGCDTAQAAMMRTLAGTKLGGKPGAARRIDQAFERQAQCAARKAVVAPALAAWLSAMR